MNTFWKMPIQWMGSSQKPFYSNITSSITENIKLILNTSCGSWSYDTNFGCIIWDWKDEIYPMTPDKKSKISTDLVNKIQLYEKRLLNPNVVKIEAFPYEKGKNIIQINCQITGKISQVNKKEFNHKFNILIK